MALDNGQFGNCSPEPQWQAAGEALTWRRAVRAPGRARSTVSRQGGSPAWSRPLVDVRWAQASPPFEKGAPSRLVVILHPVQTEEEDGPWPCPWAGTV